MEITKRSEATGIVHTREVDIQPWEWARYKRGELGYVQEAFPHLSAGDKEFLVTGVTPEEWDELFGDIEEDEEANYTGYPDFAEPLTAEQRYDWGGFRF